MYFGCLYVYQMSERTYVRFNKEHAIKRGHALGDYELEMTDGDDRSSFLRGQPLSVSYWWEIFDVYNLLFRTILIFEEDTGVSSDRIPSSIQKKIPKCPAPNDISKSNEAKLIKAQKSIF